MTATISDNAGNTWKFSYNLLGEKTSQTAPGTGTTNASVTTSAGTSTYTYDANGNLLLQHDPGTTTLYLDNGAEQLTLDVARQCA